MIKHVYWWKNCNLWRWKWSSQEYCDVRKRRHSAKKERHFYCLIRNPLTETDFQLKDLLTLDFQLGDWLPLPTLLGVVFGRNRKNTTLKRIFLRNQAVLLLLRPSTLCPLRHSNYILLYWVISKTSNFHRLGVKCMMDALSPTTTRKVHLSCTLSNKTCILWDWDETWSLRGRDSLKYVRRMSRSRLGLRTPATSKALSPTSWCGPSV